jgi:transposase
VKHPSSVQKKQRRFYSGKKRSHTLKMQLVIDQLTGLILCTFFGVGRTHDFRLFKASQVRFAQSQMCLADKGYQGLDKRHAHSCTPFKKRRKQKLTLEERAHNRSLAQLRVVVEHANRRLKIFRILSERYRNRRKRFGLRVNLIAGLLNYELSLKS